MAILVYFTLIDFCFILRKGHHKLNRELLFVDADKCSVRTAKRVLL